jgi:large subunit ribosomal protein L25
MSDILTLSAVKRDRAGKGSARAARRDGKIPAVIYGDRKEPLSVTLDANQFRKLISQSSIFSQLLNVKVDGEDNSVLTRDIQLHPVTDTPLHADFLRISKGAKVTVMVAVQFINEELSPGLKTGGILNVVRHEIELSCPAASIPDNIIIDLDGTNVGDSIHISAVSLPDEVEPTISDRDFTIATIAAPAAEEIDVHEIDEDEDIEGQEGESAGDAEADTDKEADADSEKEE